MKRRGKGSKNKGSNFERIICKKLSLWVTHGKKEDCFWRSAMSGGRATVGRARGVDLARQAGDISATSPEGHVLTDKFYIECKFYKSLRIGSFIFGYGPLALFWRQSVKEAAKYKRKPLLIAKENAGQIIVISDHEVGRYISYPRPMQIADVHPLDVMKERTCYVYLFDSFLKTRFELGSK
jgi:hypothetical protein